MCSEIVETFEITEPSVALSHTAQVTNPMCFGNMDVEIDISLAGGIPPYIFSWSNGQNTEDLNNLATGTYEVTIQDSSGCIIIGSYGITTPPEMLTTVSVADESCYGKNDGAIFVPTSGGVGPYQYIWSNGASGSANQALSPATYAVTITDVNGCSDKQTGLTVEAGLQVMAGYTVPTSVIYLTDGGSLQFTNISIGASNYMWDFGTGEFSTLSDPLYTFANPGEYEVALTASAGVCTSTSSNIISVSANVGIAGTEGPSSQLTIAESNGKLEIALSDPRIGEIDITVHNILGQLVFRYDDWKVNQGQTALDLTDLKSGVYIVRVTGGDISEARKFTIK